MKKIFLGIVWFLVIWIGSLAIGGAIVGSLTASKADTVEQAQQLSYQAGQQFGIKYGGIIFISALVLTIAGTVTGVLPGTKTAKKPESN